MKPAPITRTGKPCQTECTRLDLWSRLRRLLDHPGHSSSFRYATLNLESLSERLLLSIGWALHPISPLFDNLSHSSLPHLKDNIDPTTPFANPLSTDVRTISALPNLTSTSTPGLPPGEFEPLLVVIVSRPVVTALKSRTETNPEIDKTLELASSTTSTTQKETELPPITDGPTKTVNPPSEGTHRSFSGRGPTPTPPETPITPPTPITPITPPVVPVTPPIVLAPPIVTPPVVTPPVVTPPVVTPPVVTPPASTLPPQIPTPTPITSPILPTPPIQTPTPPSQTPTAPPTPPQTTTTPPVQTVAPTPSPSPIAVPTTISEPKASSPTVVVAPSSSPTAQRADLPPAQVNTPTRSVLVTGIDEAARPTRVDTANLSLYSPIIESVPAVDPANFNAARESNSASFIAPSTRQNNVAAQAFDSATLLAPQAVTEIFAGEPLSEFSFLKPLGLDLPDLQLELIPQLQADLALVPAFLARESRQSAPMPSYGGNQPARTKDVLEMPSVENLRARQALSYPGWLLESAPRLPTYEPKGDEGDFVGPEARSDQSDE